MFLRQSLRGVATGLAAARGAGSTTRSYAAQASLSAARLHETTTTHPKAKPPTEGLVFGTKFSDHMLIVDWSSEQGWKDPQIVPYGPMPMDPSACVFHYAVECFEGMKAYRGVDGKVRLFRPDLNAARMCRSSERISLPTFDQEEFVKLVAKLVNKDADWVPEGIGYSMYLRPTMIATQAALGVAPTTEARLFTIMSPVGPYYSSGFAPVKLLADPSHTRAWPGGVGFTKCGGNYAPTIKPMADAQKLHGCQQVLWLFGEEELVTEVGTMNLFMHWVNDEGVEELITPPLDDTILDGVTRRSTLELARGWGELQVSEKYFTMPQLVRALESGRVREMFGVGTAACVSPISDIVYAGTTLNVPLELGDSGVLGKRVLDTLFDIQYGRVDHEWAVVV